MSRVKLPEGAHVCVMDVIGDRLLVVARWDRGHRTEYVSWRVTAGAPEYGRYFNNLQEAMAEHAARMRE